VITAGRTPIPLQLFTAMDEGENKFLLIIALHEA
jgi:hypothetical protein